MDSVWSTCSFWAELGDRQVHFPDPDGNDIEVGFSPGEDSGT